MKNRMSVWVLGMALLSSASAQSTTLKLVDWPLAGMPSAEDQAADPSSKAYAEVLQKWLAENPDVALETISFSQWDQQALVTGIVGGAAPTYYPGQVLGGWNPVAMQTAFKQGLAADVTEAVEKYGVLDEISPEARAVYERERLEGKYYGLPVDFTVSQGVYYRKDLVKALGLKEPQAGWTWEEFLTLAAGLTSAEAGRVGASIQDWLPGEAVNSAGGMVVPVHMPETNWNVSWVRSPAFDKGVAILETWRKAIYEDKTVRISANEGDNDRATQFIEGQAGMWVGTPNWYTRPPSADFAMATLADRVGKPIDEVVGWVEFPRSASGIPTQGPLVFLASVDPNLDEAGQDAAVNFLNYMIYGEGAAEQAQLVYAATEDARNVYPDPYGPDQIEGIPESKADVWGAGFIENVEAAASNPVAPNPSDFIPVEANPGPSTQALTDAYNTVINAAGAIDIAAEYERAMEVVNQTANGYTSSIPDEELRTKMAEYYEAYLAFYQESYPAYYEEVAKPLFDEQVAPALGEATASR